MLLRCDLFGASGSSLSGGGVSRCAGAASSDDHGEGGRECVWVFMDLMGQEETSLEVRISDEGAGKGEAVEEAHLDALVVLRCSLLLAFDTHRGCVVVDDWLRAKVRVKVKVRVRVRLGLRSECNAMVN